MTPCLFVMMSLWHWQLAASATLASQESELPRKEVAALMAALHSYERTHGRDSWSWQSLQAARTQVYDPLFALQPLPDWVNRGYVALLQWFHLIGILVLLAGLWMAWKLWRQRSVWKALGWSVLWFALLFSLHWAIAPDNRTHVVIKSDGIVLRQGNGLSYPAYVYQGLPIRLAAGVEAEVRTQRSNGWVQITLPGGKVGWIPVDGVYVVK